jgi:hypothetical protein
MSPAPPLKIIIIRETWDYVKWRYGDSGSWQSKPLIDRKRLCLGGPFGGQRKARPQLDGMGYVGYNAAKSHRIPGVQIPPKALWVHESLL